MKPDRPPAIAGFIDRKLLNQACLKHHISIGAVFDPLNRCVLCGKKHINFVLDPPGRQNKLHNLREAPGCSLQIEAGLHLGRSCTCHPAHNASHWLVAK